MTLRMAAIILCVAVAGAPTLARAQAPKAQKPVAGAAPKAGGAAAKKSTDKKSTDKKSTDKKSTDKKTTEKKPVEDTTALRSAYAAMPRDERLAIQSDLAWLGHYAGPPGGDFDDRAIAAVKAFQQASHAMDTGLLDAEQRARLAAAAPARQRAVGWRLIEDPATGARFGVPEKLVTRVGDLRTGSAWTSGHGQIQIKTFGLSEAGLPALFEDEKTKPRGRRVDAGTLGADSFVISGTQGLKYFVVRAEAKAGKVRGITILYDQATIGIMAPVAIAMANSFVGFPSSAPPRQEGAVEYGTAIVADGSGDLVTSGDMTADCTAIAVPGFGYAARVAADPTSDVALLRLYGARDLVPAGLADENLAGESKDGELMLVGVADPLVQNGGDSVTKEGARLYRNVITPVPQPGFSGAAAIDAQGRFVGIVDFKFAAGADSEPAAAQAILVPAGSVHTFLVAHNIAATTTHGTTEQSVLRIICLRNERDNR
jgi:peptidoglycan hydrolase-like protein with peptidoglycan-binding domain